LSGDRRPPASSRPLLELVREKSSVKLSLDTWETGATLVSFAFWVHGRQGRPICLRRIGLLADELPQVVAVLQTLVPEEAVGP
jgi:hypothetical protein